MSDESGADAPEECQPLLPPPLSESLRKGDAGRIGVLGGCKEYSGAPYFAAMSAYLVGADISHVFCERKAASVIKSYSPDLIVHPYLRGNEGDAAAVEEWLPRLHVLVVGPGLGRASATQSTTEKVIRAACAAKMPLVIDADGLLLVKKCAAEIRENAERVVLTPNGREFERLHKDFDDAAIDQDALTAATEKLSATLGNVTIVHKGQNDIITDGKLTRVCEVSGGLRRCGGQGDVLSGAIATCLAWTFCHPLRRTPVQPGASVMAALAAASLVRASSSKAFGRSGRSMTTSDVLDCIKSSFPIMYSQVPHP